MRRVISLQGDAPTVYDAVGLATTLDDENATTQDITGSLKLSLHVGADATSNNQITVKLEAMSAKGLGVNGLKVDGTDDTNAKNAIETIKESIQKVSTQRSALGAVQNRLEHTISNLDNVVENTTSAESQIRDTDMATEMVKYSTTTFWRRQVRQCWHRLTSPIRVYCLCYSNYKRSVILTFKVVKRFTMKSHRKLVGLFSVSIFCRTIIDISKVKFVLAQSPSHINIVKIIRNNRR